VPADCQDSLQNAISQAEGLYYRLVLLVGRSGAGKTGLLQGLSAPLNVNLALSRLLLECPRQRRASRVAEFFQDLVRGWQEADNAPKATARLLVLDNIEILFDRSLSLDPLRLLQSVSRNSTIVASWGGAYRGGKLTYARLGHPEYRVYEKPEAQIIVCDEVTE